MAQARWKRIALGMFAAPLVASGCYNLIVQATGLAFLGKEGFYEDAIHYLGDFLLVCLYTYPIGWILGLPAFAAYQRLGLTSLRSYSLGGLVGGTLVGMCMLAVPDSGYRISPFVDALIWLWLPIGIAAAVSCAFFWAVAVRNRRIT